MIGSRFGKFEITAKLGEGGMGVVYEALDTGLDRKVAVKLLPERTANDPGHLERFRREAKAVAALNHPNIVTIHGIESAEDKQFLVMELIEGESLDRMIGREGMPLARVFDIAIPIADALGAAHAKGVVHRDVKPANVMVTPDGQVKVLDFGLAKAAAAPITEDDETRAAPTPLTGEGVVVGTAPYMSPEQLQGFEVDQRGDIFSLGVLLFEMVTGSRPFGGESGIALASSILKDTPDSVSELRADLPRQLGRIIHQCLEKDPDRRFQTVRDVRNLLESLRREIVSGPSAPKPAISTPSRRWPVVAGVVGLLAVVIGLVAWRGLTPTDRTNAAPEAAHKLVVLPFQNLGEPDDEYFADGMTEEVTSRLGALKGLSVISRASAMRFKTNRPPLSEIGEQLGVDYVLDGTVRWQRAGDGPSTVRVTPQLIRVAEDTQIWNHSYDAVLADIFEVQSDIAQQVSEALGVELLHPSQEASASRSTDDLEAYDIFLRANEYYNRGIEVGHDAEIQIAARLYDQAVTLDPGFALGHARAAMAHEALYNGYDDHTSERLQRARESVRRAVDLDPHLPEALHARGRLYMVADRDDRRALEEYRRAIALRPSAEVYLSMSEALGNLEMWEEADRAAQRAVELDPHGGEYFCSAGGMKIYLREFQEGLDLHERAIQLIPDRWCPYFCKANIFLNWDGDTARARRFLETLPPDLPLEESPPINHPWVWVEMFDGNYEAALARLDSGDAAAYEFAQYYTPKDLLRAKIHRLAGSLDLAREYYQTAAELLESKVAEDPEDERLLGSLAIAYAGLGRREDALRQAARVVQSREARPGFWSGYHLRELAETHLLLGNRDEAIRYLNRMLSSPGFFAVAAVKADPTWRELRDHPGFVDLLEEHGG